MTIVGACLQGVGLAFVFGEIIAIRIHEWGVPNWVAKLRKRRDVHIVAGSATLGKRSGLEPPTPSVTNKVPDDSERIAALEEHVTEIDAALAKVPAAIDQQVAEAIARATEGDEAIRKSIQNTDEQRRKWLRRSLWRQLLGAIFVALGLLLGTAGAVNSAQTTRPSPPVSSQTALASPAHKSVGRDRAVAPGRRAAVAP